MPDLDSNRDIVTQVNKHFTHSAQTYHCGAQLQKQVGKKLLSLLPDKTGTTLDLGCGPGLFTDALDQRSSKLCSLDLSPEMLKQHCKSSLKINADSHALPFSGEVFDNVFSSLMIQWCELETVLQEVVRVLKPGGKAVISTLVLGTLLELKQAWAQLDDDEHIHQYLTFNNVENCVAKLLTTDSSVTQQPMVLHFDSVYLLAKELKQLGANFVKDRKNKGLVTKSKWQRLEQSYQTLFGDQSGKVPATYEVVFIELTK